MSAQKNDNPGDGTSESCSLGAGAAGSMGGNSASDTPLGHFSRMISNCLEYAREAKDQGKRIVGIMCEYTPREIIMAAGGEPVCLCGGDQVTIPKAEEDLPANLCPLIKSTYGYHLLQSNPFLEMADLVVAETTCDGKKKMYELMAQSRPMYVLELTQKPDDPDAFAHWQIELAKLKTHMEERFQTQITEEKLREAIRRMNRERALRRRLATLMAQDQPPLTGLELLELKSIISGIDADFTQYEAAFDYIQNRKADSTYSSRARVMMTGVPMAHGSERVLQIVEDHGGLVVAMENCTGLKPIMEDVDENAADPMKAIAEKYFHLPCSVMTPNTGRLDLLRSLAREYRPECVIDLVWQACLTYDVESPTIRKFTEQELGIPYMHIETDYSPSDSERIAVRVEALFETLGTVVKEKEKPAPAAKEPKREKT